MRKSRLPQPKRLQICLTIPPQIFDLNIDKKYNKSHYNIIQSSSCSINNSKQNQVQVRDVIRLGSKKKRMKRQQKQNIICQLPKQLISTPKHQKSNSLNKYFQSNNKILMNSNVMNMRNNTQCPESDKKLRKSRQRTQFNHKQNDKQNNKTQTRSIFNKTNKTCHQKSIQKNLNSRLSNKISNLEQNRSCSLNKRLRNQSSNSKLEVRLQKIKQYRFIQQYLTDLQLQGIFNQLEITGVPEVKWPLIVVDKVYQLIRRKNFNHPHQEIIRKF